MLRLFPLLLVCLFLSACEEKTAQANMQKSNLAGEDFSGKILRNVDLRGSNMTKMRLEKAQFDSSDMRYVNLAGSRAPHASFSETVLCSAVLAVSDLRNVNFQGADLTGADLKDTYLQGANFYGSTLVDTDFEGARRDEEDPPIPGYQLVEGRLRDR